MEEKLRGESKLDKKFLYFLLQMHKILDWVQFQYYENIGRRLSLFFVYSSCFELYSFLYPSKNIQLTTKSKNQNNLLALPTNIENRRNRLQYFYLISFLFKVLTLHQTFTFISLNYFFLFNCTFIYFLRFYSYKFPFQNIRFIILPLYMKYTFVAGLFGLACAATAAPNPVPLTANKKVPTGVLSSTNTKLELNADKILGSNIASSKISSLETTSSVKGGTSGSSSSTKTTVTTLSSSGSGGFSGSASSGGSGTLGGGSRIISSNINQFGNNEGYQSSFSKSENLFDNIGGYQFEQYNYSPSNSYDYDRNYNSARVINQAKKSLVTPKRSLDSLFLRFPSCSQLDRLILSADAAAILKTIQTIATDVSVPCHQRLTYLSQLLGRLKTAVQKKVYNANQLKIVIDSSIIQIQKLTSELQLNKKYVNNLGIPELRERQAKAIAELQDAYAKLNNFQGTTPVLQAKIKGYERQVELLGKNSDKERGRIDSDKLRFIDISNQVANLEARLKQLSDKKVKINGNIVKGQNTVKDNQVNINKLRADAQSIQLQLKNIRDTSDKVNYDVRDLQVKVERYRTDASVAQVKRDRYLKQITELNDKINAEKKKLVDDDLISLSQMIDNLKNLLRTVEKTIDQRYFRCYGVGDGVKIEQSGDTVIYVVNGESFADYLKEHYGQSIQTPSIRSNNVSLNRVNIFGTDWTGQYGYPFMDKQFDTVDFSINGSFNCLNEGELMTGSGVISDIGSNYIEAVGDDGENRRFSLGSCSRLESTLKVPKKGQKFYWKGARGGQGYNLFGGSCIE